MKVVLTEPDEKIPRRIEIDGLRQVFLQGDTLMMLAHTGKLEILGFFRVEGKKIVFFADPLERTVERLVIAESEELMR